MVLEVFNLVLENYIDKFTVYGVPSCLQLIYLHQQLQTSADHIKIYQEILDQLEQIDKLLNIRALSNLRISTNLSQSLVHLLTAENQFIKLHDKILTNCYESSISYQEYISGAQADDTNGSILKNELFLKFNKTRLLEKRVTQRKIFGN